MKKQGSDSDNLIIRATGGVKIFLFAPMKVMLTATTETYMKHHMWNGHSIFHGCIQSLIK